MVAPDVIELDDVGFIGFDQLKVPEGLEAKARRAVRACPERALSIEEE
jgi:ferredoxin